MKQFYMVMGDFDFVGICEAPDDAVLARYVSQLGGLWLRAHQDLEGIPGGRRGRDRQLPQHRMGLIGAGACLARRR
jgi:hypothetical protein